MMSLELLLTARKLQVSDALDVVLIDEVTTYQWVSEQTEQRDCLL